MLPASEGSVPPLHGFHELGRRRLVHRSRATGAYAHLQTIQAVLHARQRFAKARGTTTLGRCGQRIGGKNARASSWHGFASAVSRHTSPTPNYTQHPTPYSAQQHPPRQPTTMPVSQQSGGAPAAKFTDNSADVIVIGAGMSGLFAAHNLVRRGHSVIVLEACDRVGGRIRSEHFDDGAHVDLGAAWIGPSHYLMLELVRSCGGRLFPQYDDGYSIIDTGKPKLGRYKGTIPAVPLFELVEAQVNIMWRLDAMAKKVPIDEPHRCKRAHEWDAMSLQAWMNAHLFTHGASELLCASVRLLFGAEPSEVSFLYFLWFVHCSGGIGPLVDTEGGAQEMRVEGGMQAFPEKLRERVDASGRGRCVLSAPVVAIKQHGSEVATRSEPELPEATERGSEESQGTSPRITVQNSVRAASNAAATSSVPGHEDPAARVATAAQRLKSGDVPTASKESKSRHRQRSAGGSNNNGERCVEVTTPAGTFRSAYVICTAAPKIADRITFEPRMPRMRQKLVDDLRMGSYTKVVAFYDTAFWRDVGYSGGSIRTQPTKDSLIVGTFDYCEADGGHPALCCLLAGDMARHFDHFDEEAKNAHVVKYLSKLFGDKAAKPKRIVSKSWADHTWTGGCPVNFPPAGSFAKRSLHLLSRPFGRIHFAGTEVATRWPAYMEGALDAGQKAALEVSALLQGDSVVAQTTSTPSQQPQGQQLDVQLGYWDWRRAKTTSAASRGLMMTLCVGVVVVAVALQLLA